ncbi:hypothetical protein HYR99_33205, partial [Candidatus Poribacteria bacterium]|nr:hypothetical protein [Candidatus Poribacteria bacterium]
RLVADAAERAAEIDFKATVDKTRKRKRTGIAVAAVAGATLLALIFPSQIGTALHRLLLPWEKTEPVLATKLIVTPGKTRILRGESLAINVEVKGNSADKVTLAYTKPGGSARMQPSSARDADPQVERSEIPPSGEAQVNMVQLEGEKRRFGYEIFNINENMQYYVTANGTESERYTVEVFDMPKVTAIEVAYTYPEYTQLKPVVQQGDGNIRAATGSVAEVRITMNKGIQSATFTVEGKEPRPMTIADGRTLTTALDVVADGKYTVELLCIDGFKNQTPIEYLITAIPDEPPKIVIKKPGRDIKATKLEEVQVLAEATDDYGIAKMALKYSVGSGEPKELRMETVDIEEKKLISGTYTFYLEELNVNPGDVISYFAEATDNNTRTGPGKSISELYFIEVRPFTERYEEMEAQSGQQQGDMNMLSGLAATQKQIIKETWQHINSRPFPITDDYKFAVKKTGEKQSDLKNKVQRAIDEISTFMRTGSVPPEVLMKLESAIDKMRQASDELYAIEPRKALPYEQDALELLVKVMMEMQKVLTRMRQSGNQEVADNIEMEMNDLQNQFEEDQNELDEQMRERTQEMLNQTREMLAQQRQLTQQSQQLGREQQPSQREMQQNSQQQSQLGQQTQQMGQQMSQMGQQGSQQSGQGGTGQRMAQAGQAMLLASEQMQQSAQNMQQQRPQMSAAKGQKAEEKLQQAIEELEKAASQFTDQALNDTTEKLDRLMAEQSAVREQTEALQERTQQNGVGQEDLRRASQLANQQRGLRQDLDQLQRDLSSLQQELNKNAPQAARNVGDARRRIADEQVPQNMESAQRALQWRDFESAEGEQREALESLLRARDDLQQAQANTANTEEEKLETALEQLERWEQQMQDIQRELEAMDTQRTPLTPEQQRRQQQLSEQQAQLQQRAQQAQQQAQQRGQQPGQGQQNGQANQQARAGMESDRELKELWLGMLNAMNARRGNRRAPFPNYDLTFRELNKLKRALEDRLVEIQEKKRLAQVLKEDVPPEYRPLVERYYESLAK